MEKIWRPVFTVLLIASLHSMTVGGVCQNTVTYNSKELDVCQDSAHVSNEVTQNIIMLIESEVECTLPTEPPSTETPTTPPPTSPTTPNGTFQNPASSCKYIPAGSPSGLYWISNGPQSATQRYCDMSRSCCGSTGGWMRVADIDMTDPNQQCPTGFPVSTVQRSCRNGVSIGCTSTTFALNSIEYTKVCGRVIGYQDGTTDAFSGGSRGIDDIYVDGISLTHGSPRNHIWTFVAALNELEGGTITKCPCTNAAIRNTFPSDWIPSFVGQDYFCDTGDYARTRRYDFSTTDPLWDGQGCNVTTGSTCCTLNNPPWFCKQLPSSTRDDIELRLCRTSSAEDSPFEIVEIYVQ